MFLHELSDAKDLFLVISEERGISSSIVEKDYWVMHALWGLQQQHDFELKGGTSLSKAYNLINRFSEDIDVQVHPKPELSLKTGKNHDKASHIKARSEFFDDISDTLTISGLSFSRDHGFDDKKMRSAGIRGHYDSHFEPLVRAGYLVGIPEWTAHDLRRTFATQLGETLKIDPVVIEKCLEHKMPRIMATYNRNEMLPQRKDALNSWAECFENYCKDKVVYMHLKAK